jgi:hypothetical protein
MSFFIDSLVQVMTILDHFGADVIRFAGDGKFIPSA